MSKILTTSHLLLWLIVSVQTILIVSLMRQVGSLLLRVGPAHALDAGVGPQVGEPAPWVPNGESKVAGAWDRPLLLTFMSTSCGACDELVPAINAIHATYTKQAAVLVLVRDEPQDVERWTRIRGVRAPVISAPEAFEQFSIGGTPYAFALDEERVVAARGGVNHLEHLEALLRTCQVARESTEATQELFLLAESPGGEANEF